MAVEEESMTPMLEMASRVRATSPATESDEEEGGGDQEAPSKMSKVEEDVQEEEREEEREEEELGGLASEFAVGTNIPQNWDDDMEVGDDYEWLEAQLTRATRACTRGFCKLLGARRLGHMAVLRTTKKNDATQIRCIVGPFWPFACIVTYPLVICISTTVGVFVLPGRSLATTIVWCVSVASLLVALSLTSCRDPGILRRRREQPNASWRWNDQARTFRPPEAVYDDDLGLVVEQFDHVCPWTGTGIGGGNITAFHAFVTLLCVCVALDVLLVMSVLP